MKTRMALLIFIVLAFPLMAQSSVFPEWNVQQGMSFLAGFSCTIGAVVSTTALAFSINEVESGKVMFPEFHKWALLDAFFIFVACSEYYNLFSYQGQLKHASLHAGNNLAWATEIKIQGFTVAKVY